MASELETLSSIEGHGSLNPIQRSRLEELRRAGSMGNPHGIESATGSFLGRGISGGGAAPIIDPIEQARKLRAFTIEANQPAIASLQAQIPETQQRFAGEKSRILGEKEPLKERYNAIISELTRREGTDIAAQQRRTGQEFGYRGIPASSTLYQDELIARESPIRQAYGGQIANVGFEREEGLRNLDTLAANLEAQGIDAVRQIENAKASLLSGDPASALSGAMQLLGLQQQAAQFEANLGLQKEQLALSEREFGLQSQIANKPGTEIVNIGGRAKLINTQTGAVIQDLGLSGSPSTGSASERASSSALASLREMIARGVPHYELRPLFSNALPEYQIREEYNKASPLVKKYGQAKEAPLSTPIKTGVSDEEIAKTLGLDVATYRAYKAANIL